MRLKPIKTENDYNQALNRLEKIFDAQPGTKEGDELEILGILIGNYENENFPIDLPDPIEAIKFRMEQLNYSQSDLAEKSWIDRTFIIFLEKWNTNISYLNLLRICDILDLEVKFEKR